jgi:2-dehydro-3-deoxygalactonokinase
MYLAIEWTSAAFHALQFADDGTLLAERKDSRGINQVADRAFLAVLEDVVGDWCREASRIYLSGMITSRNGWIETPYAEAPATLSDVVARAVTENVHDLPTLIFLPGVAVRDPLPDVMRGEELKVFGAMGTSTGLVVLPGPHTKWAVVKEGCIERFATYMTGEITALLKANSLVGRLIPAQPADNPEAFLRGVRLARDREIGGNVLRRIFSARSLVLFDELAPEDIAEYLSGLMIGAEIREAAEEYSPSGTPINLIGPPDLCGRYTLALHEFGLLSRLVSTPEIAAFGALALT